jgi:ATP-binding cassette subfamily F protein uup
METTATPKQKRLSYNEQREFDSLQKEVSRLEEERKLILEQLNTNDLPFENLQKLANKINEINFLIDEKELRWLELSEKREPF